MERRQHLIVDFGGTLYGVQTRSVEEIVSLPELTPISEAQSAVPGFFNLRGKIVPVIDLHRWLGRRTVPYSIGDSVVILKNEKCSAGIIVNSVVKLQRPSDRGLTPLAGVSSEGSARGASRLANLEREIVVLPDPDKLLQYAEEASADMFAQIPDSELYFCPTATPEERAIFAERARSLAEPLYRTDPGEVQSVAVVRIGGEFFGVALEDVREFSDPQGVTPVPCTPEHVRGVINLRGELVALVDVRRALHLDARARVNPGRIVVAEKGRPRTAVLVDDICDVIQLDQATLEELPTAVRSSTDKYLKGMAVYRDRAVGILDLPNILNSQEMTFEEEVSSF